MSVFYVSPTGNEASTGTAADPNGSAGPFATLARALQAARASAGADTIVIRGGTYNAAAPLNLTAADSNLSILAFAGEQAVISGGTTVGGWTIGSNGVWTAHVPLTAVQQFVVNGVSQTEARYPNYDPTDPIRGGWAWAQPLPTGHNALRELAYDKSAFTATQLTAGERVVVQTQNGYSGDVLTIASVDFNTGIITFTSDATYDLGAGSRFYVEGGPALLDKPGEWWFDKASQTLSYLPPTGFTGTGAVASGGNNDLININGATNVTIQGLTLTNVATTSVNGYGDDTSAAIGIVNGSSNIVVNGNSFTNVAIGVRIDDRSNNVTVSNNNFSQILSAAVDLTATTYQNTVTNNTIDHSGSLYTLQGAIAMTESSGNVISHNLIQDVPRFGIAEGNHDPAIPSGGNTIEYNIIRNSGQATPDTGAIYAYSADDPAASGDVIRYNQIINSGGVTTTPAGFVAGQNFSWGIYLDDNVNNARVYGNFVSGTANGGVMVHGGTGDQIYNNVLVNSAKFGAEALDLGSSMTGTTFHDNVIALPSSGGSALGFDPAFLTPASVHGNVYVSPTGAAPLVSYDEIAYAQWRAQGGDIGSTIATSAGFTNAAADDFSFAPGSAALSQGMPQVPFSQIGPQAAAAPTPAPAVAAVPHYDHIVVVMMENHDYSEIIGNTSEAPYINALAASGALLTNYSDSGVHPSEPNYLALYAGSTFGVTDDNFHSQTGPTLGTILQAAGKTFTGYVENPGDQNHNPWEYFPNPLLFESDFASAFPMGNFASLPNVSFVIPNKINDMHDGTISQGDAWLQANINAYAQWAVANNSLLDIVWDEGSGGDQVASILIGANVVPGTYNTAYNHYNTLSTILAANGLSAPNNAATAAPIAVFGPSSGQAAPLTPDLTPGSDSGVSNTDNVTSVTTPTVTGSAPAGSIVTLFDGTTAVGSAVATAGGTWSITSTVLGNGNHSLTATATDAAGNVSTPSASLAVTIQTTAPAAPSAPDLTPASDDGVSNTDDITSITTPTFTGSAPAGNTVTLFDGTTPVGSATASAGGTWSITSSTLGDGTHTLIATDTDAAGNASAPSAALAVTIQTTVPAAPSAPDLTPASDDGVSNADDITSITTPTFTGSAPAGNTVTLFDGTTPVGSATASAGGTWSITSSTLGDGTHTLIATDTDAAGNVSAPSAALAVTIQTIAPATLIPSRVALSPTTRSLADAQSFAGLAAKTSLATINQLRGTAGDTFSYKLGGTDAAAFRVSPTNGAAILLTGAIRAAGGADGRLYAITLTATDQTTGDPSPAVPLDVVVGTSGSDTITLSSLVGALSPDTPNFIYGLGGGDTIDASGMAGPVWFAAGAGGDIMTGGSGVNDYLYGARSDSTRSFMDIIKNFHTGMDIIDLTGLGTGMRDAGQITNSRLAAHSVGWQVNGGNTFIYVNTSGERESPGGANMKTELEGVVALSGSDIQHN